MPTVLDLAGAKYPDRRNGQTLHPLEGASLRPIFDTGARMAPAWMYWEHRHQGAVRHGSWKAVVQTTSNAWSLYNMDSDRAESRDLATAHPEILDRLRGRWETWADAHLVFPKPSGQRRVP
jgi:arylsulfatase